MQLVAENSSWWIAMIFDCNSCQRTYKLTLEDSNLVKIPRWNRLLGLGYREIWVTCLCGKTSLFNDGV